MAIRFALDQSYLKSEPEHQVNHSIVYSGPPTINSLVCGSCKALLLEKDLNIRGAPSDNWKDVVQLWQCHTEKFDKYINPITQDLVVPDDTLLDRFNALVG